LNNAVNRRTERQTGKHITSLEVVTRRALGGARVFDLFNSDSVIRRSGSFHIRDQQLDPDYSENTLHVRTAVHSESFIEIRNPSATT